MEGRLWPGTELYYRCGRRPPRRERAGRGADLDNFENEWTLYDKRRTGRPETLRAIGPRRLPQRRR